MDHLMTSSPATISPATISAEFFNSINARVSSHIRKKLHAMQIEVVDLELHNSSLTKTFRVYLTVKRSANLKTLSLAEQMICQDIERQFAFRPHACYWRYPPDSIAAKE
jgi:hypothetical protein